MDLGKVTRQVELERQSKLEGEHRVNQRSLQMIEKGQGSQTASGKSFVTLLMEVTQLTIESFLLEFDEKRPGRDNIELGVIRAVEPDVLSAITLKTVINYLLNPGRNKTYKSERPLMTFTRLAIVVGKAVEDEINVRLFEEDQPDLVKRITGVLVKRSSGYIYTRRKLREAAERHSNNDWSVWSDHQRWAVGVRLIECIMQHTDLIEVKLVRSKDRKTKYVQLADYAIQQMRKIENLRGIRSPKTYPTIIRPRSWSAVSGEGAGGFHSHHMPPLPLVKSYNRAYLEELSHFDLTEIFDSVNSLQNTAWKLNPFIQERFNYLWGTQSRLGRLPIQDLDDAPSKPFDIAENKTARDEYRKAAAIYYTERQKQLGKVGMHDQLKTIADKFTDEKELYFVYTVDFRGRAYPKASYLQPQGNDVSRALLTFGDRHAKNMDEDSARELALYGASLYGYDKVSLDDRVEWVEEHTPEIIASATDCYDNRFWCDPKKPFLFLSFCNEWKQWKEKGEDYKSSYPVMRDGTCNAFQHWAALLKDESTAIKVNLSDQELPEDVYQAAAEILIEGLKDHVRNEGGKTCAMAKAWLDFGVDRSLLKTPTMTRSYGSGLYAMMSHDHKDGSVESWVKEKCAEKYIPLPFDGDLNKPIHFLAKQIDYALSKVVSSVSVGMDFLQQCARVMNKADMPITWVTPSNFYVRQAYNDLKARRVKTKFLGDYIRSNLSEIKHGKYDKTRMVNALSANFIHSLDATAMYKTINLAAKEGVTAFAMIHDSYGTIPADSKTLSRCTREAFVSLYTSNEHLKTFKDHLGMGLSEAQIEELPEVPEVGTFDITKVLNSKHFFS